MKKTAKEPTFDYRLRKAAEINDGMRVRDYIIMGLESDMPEWKKVLNDYFVEAKSGDCIMVVSFKWKDAKAKAKARAQTKKFLSRFVK